MTSNPMTSQVSQTPSTKTGPATPGASGRAAGGAAATIRVCLDRIRRRLFVMRAIERVAVALMIAAVVAVAFVLARYLRERYFAYALLAAASPAGMVAAYWALRGRWRWVGRIRSPFCLKLASVLTLALVALGVSVFAGAVWAGLPTWAFAAAPLGAFVILAVVQGRAVTPQAAAIFVDQQVGLEERVSTAYEMLHRPAASAEEARFQAPLVASAAGACATVRSSKVGYARLDRRVYLAAAVCAAAAVGVTFMQPLQAIPVRSATEIKRAQASAKAAADLEKALADLARRHEEKTGNKNDAALQPLRAALDELKSGTPRDPLAAIDRGRDALKEQLGKYDSSERAQKALAGSREMNELAKAIEQAAKAREGNANGQNNASEAAAREAMAEKARALADKLRSGAMTAAERAEAIAALEKAAAEAAGDPELQRLLKEASEQLAAGDAGKFEEAMKAAGSRIAATSGDRSRDESTIKSGIATLDEMAREAARQANGIESSGEKGSAGEKGGGTETAANTNGGENPGGQNGNEGGDQSGTGQQGNSGGAGQSGAASSGGGSSGDPAGSGESAMGNNAGEGGEEGTSGEGGEGSGEETAGAGSGTGGDQSAGGASAGAGTAAGGTESGGHTHQYAPSGPGGNVQTAGKSEAGVIPGGTRGTMLDTVGGRERVGLAANKRGKPGAMQEYIGSADKGKGPLAGFDKNALEAANKQWSKQVETGQIPPQYRDLIRNFQSGEKR